MDDVWGLPDPARRLYHPIKAFCPAFSPNAVHVLPA